MFPREWSTCFLGRGTHIACKKMLELKSLINSHLSQSDDSGTSSENGYGFESPSLRMGVKKMACFGLKLSHDYFGELGGTPPTKNSKGFTGHPHPQSHRVI